MISPSLLALAASPLLLNVQATVGCTDKKYDNTLIEVKVNHEPVIISRERTLYDLNKELGTQLQRVKRKNNDEYYLNEEIRTNDEWIIGGTGHGNLDTQTQVEFITIAQGKHGENTCILFKSVRVNMNYQTNMTIAKDFEEGKCEYNAVLAHEKTRHDSYTEVVNMVAEKLRGDLPGIIDSLEMGFVPSPKTRFALKQLEHSVRDAVEAYNKEALDMMEKYNEIVDSPEALKNLATNCEKQRIDELKANSQHQKSEPKPGSLGSYLKDFRREE